MQCEQCGEDSDVTQVVTVDDGQTEREEAWCPTCIADQMAEETIGTADLWPGG